MRVLGTFVLLGAALLAAADAKASSAARDPSLYTRGDHASDFRKLGGRTNDGGGFRGSKESSSDSRDGGADAGGSKDSSSDKTHESRNGGGDDSSCDSEDGLREGGGESGDSSDSNDQVTVVEGGNGGLQSGVGDGSESGGSGGCGSCGDDIPSGLLRLLLPDNYNGVVFTHGPISISATCTLPLKEGGEWGTQLADVWLGISIQPQEEDLDPDATSAEYVMASGFAGIQEATRTQPFEATMWDGTLKDRYTADDDQLLAESTVAMSFATASGYYVGFDGGHFMGTVLEMGEDDEEWKQAVVKGMRASEFCEDDTTASEELETFRGCVITTALDVRGSGEKAC